nr:MAG TPA: hypothetical protein [Caudoviricetes sp.]
MIIFFVDLNLKQQIQHFCNCITIDVCQLFHQRKVILRESFFYRRFNVQSGFVP